jgi:phosphohistidine phosphatase
MKELMLWRHAKSSWTSREQEDRQRPLNRRGRRAAAAVAAWLATRKLRPDHILCSPARRTRETADVLRNTLADLPMIELDPALYLAEGEELLQRIRRAPAAAGRLMVIGHNEGIWDLARVLAQKGQPADLASLQAKYPTGALAWLRLPITQWSELGQLDGELLHFVRPRDILAETD